MKGILTLTSKPYWVGTQTLVYMVRTTGCKLPIEVWYQGEKPDIEDAVLLPLESEKHQPASHAKAMLQSELKQILYMGSDAYPVVDVTPWFDDLGYPGAIFWREQPNGDKFNYKVYGLPECTLRTTFQVQGDTKLIDMEKCRDAVELAYEYCAGDGYQEGNYGDQSHFRAAWARECLPQASYSTDCIEWRRWKFIYAHQGRDGINPGIVHRVGSKWPWETSRTFPCPLVYHDDLPMEREAFDCYLRALQRFNADTTKYRYSGVK